MKFARELVAAQPDAEDQAAAAQLVERGGFPRDLGGAAAREGRDHRPQLYLFGGSRDGRQGDPGIGHLPDRLTPAHLIPHENSVPPLLFGFRSETRDLAGVGEFLEQGQPQTGAQ